jgi:hypothetical protein
VGRGKEGNSYVVMRRGKNNDKRGEVLKTYLNNNNFQ